MPRYASVHMLLPGGVLVHKLVSNVHMYASSPRLHEHLISVLCTHSDSSAMA